MAALVPIMAWHRPDDKPLFEPMMVGLLTHIFVTRPQWVKREWLVEERHHAIMVMILSCNELIASKFIVSAVPTIMFLQRNVFFVLMRQFINSGGLRMTSNIQVNWKLPKADTKLQTKDRTATYNHSRSVMSYGVDDRDDTKPLNTRTNVNLPSTGCSAFNLD